MRREDLRIARKHEEINRTRASREWVDNRVAALEAAQTVLAGAYDRAERAERKAWAAA
jgi:hypothetical protein